MATASTPVATSPVAVTTTPATYRTAPHRSTRPAATTDRVAQWCALHPDADPRDVLAAVVKAAASRAGPAPAPAPRPAPSPARMELPIGEPTGADRRGWEIREAPPETPYPLSSAWISKAGPSARSLRPSGYRAGASGMYWTGARRRWAAELPPGNADRLQHWTFAGSTAPHGRRGPTWHRPAAAPPSVGRGLRAM